MLSVGLILPKQSCTHDPKTAETLGFFLLRQQKYKPLLMPHHVLSQNRMHQTSTASAPPHSTSLHRPKRPGHCEIVRSSQPGSSPWDKQAPPTAVCPVRRRNSGSDTCGPTVRGLSGAGGTGRVAGSSGREVKQSTNWFWGCHLYIYIYKWMRLLEPFKLKVTSD